MRFCLDEVGAFGCQLLVFRDGGKNGLNAPPPNCKVMSFRISRFVALAMVAAVALPGLAEPAAKPAKPKGPTQAQLARKGAFPSVSASDASVKSALPATDLVKAKAKLNKTATFVGTVTDVFAPKNGKRVLLDFAPDYKKAVIGLVDAKSFKTFSDLKQLKKKRVLLSGKVIDYKGQIQVELTTASAIRLVK
ncbi:hypothetical protein IAD21_00372 [Abditibacteriota bacterium]|nr:hypothetical protein IAD21_00372 [Abditibacteriota bacterium]